MAKQKKFYKKRKNNSFYNSRKSFAKGLEIGSSNDFKIAQRYTDNMNHKFGTVNRETRQFIRRKGRVVDISGDPLPTAYDNYKSMQKDEKFKAELYKEYDY